MRKYDILICNDDEMSLPVHVCDTLEDASEWLGCNIRVLYNTQYKYNKMIYNGYVVELVKRDQQ